jgi:hypothetical protein
MVRSRPLLVSLVLLASCGKIAGLVAGDDKKEAPAASVSAPPLAPSAAEAPPPAAPPATGPYSTEGIRTTADDCVKASVLLSTSPKTQDEKYGWSFTKQALLAHPEFKISTVVPPKGASTITLQQFDFQPGKTAKPAKALMAFCNSGATCNRLAAMYKNVVRTSHPEVFCGKYPDTIKDPPSPVEFGQDAKKDLPDAKDLVSLCARLAACMIAADHNTPGDPGVECQRKPAAFKTGCATKAHCTAVLECVKK